MSLSCYQDRNFLEEAGHVAYNIVTGILEIGVSLIPAALMGFCMYLSVSTGIDFWSTLSDKDSSAGDVIKSGIKSSLANDALDASAKLTFLSLPWWLNLFADGVERLWCPMDYEADEGKVIPRPW